MPPILDVKGLAKHFTLHNQGGVQLTALEGIDLTLRSGECVVLAGPSGAGKSTLLRCVYGNYRASAGTILIRHEGREIEVTRAADRHILALRRKIVGHVSQFLRVLPRVAALDLVAEPAIAAGLAPERARERAAALLDRLAVPQRLWALSPLTFSGGEQQRVNIARGFAHDYALLLLDEPTASLDAENRRRVMDLLKEARDRGAAILGIFHDQDFAREAATRFFPMTAPERKAA
jgi:alpha-D-ribose 1-methylphosphonate 5-triphosphate synthase subunit PhnL